MSERRMRSVVKGHPNCDEGDCNTCHHVACGIQQGWATPEFEMIPDDRPIREGDMVVEGHPNCKASECDGGCHVVSCEIYQGRKDPVFVPFTGSKDVPQENGHWAIEGHPNCTAEECPMSCREVSCGIYQGCEPRKEVFIRDT